MDYGKIIIQSGEGDRGTYERHTGKPSLLAVRRRLSRERRRGDRWARAFAPAGDGYIPDTYFDIDDGDLRTIPEDLIR